MRGEHQKAVILMVREDFLRIIDEEYPKAGYGDRASFVRAAIYEFLTRRGIELHPTLQTPLSHGGRKAKGKPRSDMGHSANSAADL
jgi:hypothetical protein